MKHVAFVRPDIIQKLASGQKTMESRLSVNRPPSWAVQPGDIILFKENGGDIKLQAIAKTVHRFDKLTPTDIPQLVTRFKDQLGTTVDAPYWQTKQKSRYAVFIELDNIIPIDFPSDETPRGVMSAWVANFQAETAPIVAVQLSLLTLATFSQL